MPDIFVPLWAALDAVWFIGYMLIAFVLYRGKIATLGKRTFYLYSAVYAGVEVLGLAIFLLGIQFALKANPFSWAHEPGLFAVIVACAVSATMLMVVKKLPYIREVLESLKAPLLDPIPKQSSELLEKGRAPSP